MFGMRYLIQVMVMLGDLMLIGASALALYFYWNVFPANILVVFLVVKCFNAWQKTGSFEAWNLQVIKQFMANAKELGL